MSASRISNAAASVPSHSRIQSGQEDRQDLRLDVIREMLSTLDTLPEAGQRYIMSKVVGFVGKRIPQSGLALSRRNEATLGQIVERLERESTCLVVDAERFTQHAQILLDLLEVLARDARSIGPSVERTPRCARRPGVAREHVMSDHGSIAVAEAERRGGLANEH
jgi:hypothetical protein